MIRVREATEDDAKSWREAGHVLHAPFGTGAITDAEIMQLRMELSKTHKPLYAGRSLLEQMWQEMDDAYDKLVEDKGNQNLRGVCLGMAKMIAIMQTTTADVVREQCMERWTSRQDGQETQAAPRRKRAVRH